MNPIGISHRLLLALAVALLLAAGCGSDFKTFADGGDPGGDGFKPGVDLPQAACKKGGDADNDTIPDEVEGCTGDTDSDNLPDYQDSDSDGDGLPDALEAGPDPKKPIDTDKDGIPDYKDNDSDGDGVKDGDEDLNGDGLLGCCLAKCGEKRKGCPTVAAGACGPGQKCVSGACQPAVGFLCSDGETNPRSKTTFPKLGADATLPNFVCHKPRETASQGLKPMQFRRDTIGKWHVALEKKSSYGPVAIKNAKPLEAAASFDLVGLKQAVAGFIVSVPSPGTDAATVAQQVVTKLSTQFPGKPAVVQLVSGTPAKSHDGFPTVLSTRLAITMGSQSNPPRVRDLILHVLTSRGAGGLTQLPPANFGPPTKELILSFQTLIRPKEKRLLVMGAVAAKAMVADPNNDTAFHLDDLSNGTGLATPDDGDTVECDPFVLAGTPVADIIWIVDESGSMDDNRKDIVNNATDFFSRAVKAGLDFRMGVAGVKAPSKSVKVGKFCSRSSSDRADDGGTDRFLQPGEQAVFKACVGNPPYLEEGSEYGLAHSWEAVTRHLPRQPASKKDATKIRKGATLVVIIVSDEAPQEMKQFSRWRGKNGFLVEDIFGGTSDYQINQCTSSKKAKIDAYVKDWIALFQGKNTTYKGEAKAIVHLIGGVCKHSCGFYGPEYPWGYQEIVNATGGQIADICQKNLGATLQLIINSITGAASPMVLQYVPISASLAVALGSKQLARSRVQGFDFNSASKSLIFYGVKYKVGDQVVASYRRWIKQAGPVL